MKRTIEKLSHVRIKKNNQKRILDRVRQGETSRANLANELGLSKPAVSSNVDELLEEGIISETGEMDSAAGRKAKGLKINQNYTYFAGVIFQKTGAEIKIFDFGLNLVNSLKINIDDDAKPDEITEGIVRIIEKAAKENDYKEIAEIIVSFPGIIENNKVMLSNSLPKFRNYDFSKMTAHESVKSVTVLNDMTIKVMGAHKCLSMDKYESIIYLSHELNGLGSGLFINGRVHEGFLNTAGEIGQMYNIKDNLSYEDIENSVEQYEKILMNTLKGIDFDNEARMGELKENKNIIVQLAKYYSVIICNIFYVIAPDVVILGGLLPQLGEEFLQELKFFIKKITSFPINVQLSEGDEKTESTGFTAFEESRITNYAIDSIR